MKPTACRPGCIQAFRATQREAMLTGASPPTGAVGHDGVIASGGGSALDAAKAVALMVGQDRRLCNFEDIGDN
jgi:alcohol dehydrogenase class IV